MISKMEKKEQRDREIVDFVSDFKIVSSRQLQYLFFSDVSESMYRKVLSRLHDEKQLNRYQENINKPYLYYIGKQPKQVDHSLLTIDLYIEMKKLGWNVVKFLPSVQIGNLRPDAIAIVEFRDTLYAFFVETQLHGTMEDCTAKYKELFYDFDSWKKYFDSFPNVLVVTNRKEYMIYEEFKTLKVKTDFNDLKYIFKNLNMDNQKLDYHYKQGNKNKTRN